MSEYSEKDQLLSKLRLVTEFCFTQQCHLNDEVKKNKVVLKDPLVKYLNFGLLS